ncbi:MAG: hypothetical protein DGJ47_001129 [Rickettsiaceae bacterium]
MSKRRIIDLTGPAGINQSDALSPAKKACTASNVGASNKLHNQTPKEIDAQFKAVQELLKKSEFTAVEKKIEQGEFDINSTNISGNTLLHTYSNVHYFNPKIVVWLLKHGIDYTAINRHNNIASLFKKNIKSTHMEELRGNLLNDPEILPELKQKLRPVQHLVQEEKKKVREEQQKIREEKQKAREEQQKAQYEIDPEFKAVQKLLNEGKFAEVEKMIEQGEFNINSTNVSDNTLLHTYSNAHYFNPKIVVWLLKHGIDYTAINRHDNIASLFNKNVKYSYMEELRGNLLNDPEILPELKQKLRYIQNLTREEKQKAREEKMQKAREEKQKAREKKQKAREEKQKAQEEKQKAQEEKQKAREEKMQKAREEKQKAREEKIQKAREEKQKIREEQKQKAQDEKQKFLEVKTLLEEGKFAAVEEKIEQREFDINSTNISGNTLLHIYSCAKSFHPVIIKWLLAQNIDYTVTNKQNKLASIVNPKSKIIAVSQLREELLKSPDTPTEIKGYITMSLKGPGDFDHPNEPIRDNETCFGIGNYSTEEDENIAFLLEDSSTEEDENLVSTEDFLTEKNLLLGDYLL